MGISTISPRVEGRLSPFWWGHIVKIGREEKCGEYKKFVDLSHFTISFGRPKFSQSA
jgi:hypothetical protein